MVATDNASFPNSSKDSLGKIPLDSASLFGWKIKEVYKENSETLQNKFIANAADVRKPNGQSSDFQVPKELSSNQAINHW